MALFELFLQFLANCEEDVLSKLCNVCRLILLVNDLNLSATLFLLERGLAKDFSIIVALSDIFPLIFLILFDATSSSICAVEVFQEIVFVDNFHERAHLALEGVEDAAE